MKMCTLFKKREDGSLRAIGISLVDDAHEFGWQKEWDEDVLHFEGSVEVVEEKS